MKNWMNQKWIAVFALVLVAGCASPPESKFSDADWVSNITTGRGAYQRGDARRAADAFERAQQRARALDDADALAIAAVNRAMCLVALEQAAAALPCLDEALADARISSARRTELLVTLARAQCASGEPDAALETVASARKLNPPPALLAQALLAQSGAEFAKKNPDAARRALTDGLSTKQWTRLPLSLQAEDAERRAAIAVAQENHTEALAASDEAARLWKQADRLPEMARALAAAARQAQVLGDYEGAADRFYRSARSLGAQKSVPEAIRVLDEGVKAAERLNEPAVAKKMADLVVTFQDFQRLK